MAAVGAHPAACLLSSTPPALAWFEFTLPVRVLSVKMHMYVNMFAWRHIMETVTATAARSNLFNMIKKTVKEHRQ